MKQAVKKLGGPSVAARICGVPRTTFVHWLKGKPPTWRKGLIAMLIEIAEAT